jgi:hypothetical protein
MIRNGGERPRLRRACIDIVGEYRFVIDLSCIPAEKL